MDDDAELARSAADGDQRAWAAIYDRYADRLHDYCYSILRDRHDAADVLHDAFVTAATKIGQLRDPDRLRPWLYAVCRTQALAALRRRARESPTEDVAEMTPQSTDRDSVADHELRTLVWDAAGGLDGRERAVLDLHLRHGLSGKELAVALGVTPHHATVLLTRVRGNVERSLSALLVGRTGRQECADLDAILAGWDGTLSPLIRKRVARHIDRCERCGARRRRMVSPLALLAAVPLLPAPLALREGALDDIALVSAHGPAAGASAALRRRWMTSAAAGVAALAVLGGVLVLAQRPSATDDVPVAVAAPTGATGRTGVPALPLGDGSPPRTTAAGVVVTTGPQVLGTTVTGHRETTVPTTPSPPPDTAPVIKGAATGAELLDQQHPRSGASCLGAPMTTEVMAEVTDTADGQRQLRVWFDYALDTDSAVAGQRGMTVEGGRYVGTLGPFTVGSVPPDGGVLTIVVVARDAAGEETRSAPLDVVLRECRPAG